jgi:hypothetical protein
MTEFSPEVEKQLAALAELCCRTLEGDSEEFNERKIPLLKSLLQSGFARAGNVPLQVELDRRIHDLCREPAMHRGGSVTGLTRQLQKKFDELARWESTRPTKEEPPQAANVSSAAKSTSRRYRPTQ